MANDITQALPQQNQETSVRLGWGGVLALDRRIIDLALREQFLEALGGFGAPAPISLEADLDEGGRISVSLEGLVLGAPQVGFENATRFSQDMMLRMNIIAGEYRRVVHVPGKPKRLVESFTITEAMGYRVEAPLAVRAERPVSSRYTSLVLDLATADRFSTNLGPNDYVNTLLGRRLQEAISYMRAYQRTYSLGRFSMDDYYPLSPEQFLVRTMPAPWGQDEGSPRHGDGAMLVFMKLGIDLHAGGQPDPGIDFPYPIPEGAIGLPGTLIVVPDIGDLGAGPVQDVLKTFSLPNGYEFVINDPQPGVDLVLRGVWRESAQAVAVEPGFATVVSGQTIPFTAQGATGPVQWSANNLRRPAASGSFNGASYSPRAVTNFAEDQQMVLVTATFPEAGGEGRRNALVMESARAVLAAPRVATWVQGHEPIALRASSTDNGTLEWSLVGAVRLSAGEQRIQSLDDELGELEDLGDGRAIFTPYPPPKETPDLRIQRIRCTDRKSGESAECAVVVIRWVASLHPVPFHVPQRQSVQPTQFTVESVRPVTWTVYGEGKFVGDVYTPPDAPQLPIAVVAADDGNDRTGYAIVEFSEGRKASAGLMSWTDLSTFELKALSAPKCYANGWQQIEVEVVVAASDDENGQPIEISDADLATLKFLEVGTNKELAFLAPYEEALDAASEDKWAVNNTPNRINRQVPMRDESSERLGEIRRRRFYIHSRKPGKITLYAAMQNTDTGQWVLSEKKGEQGRIELQGLDLPSFTSESYSFKRTRVAGDESPSDGDEFAYVDNSTDYWLLEHVISEGRVTKFAHLGIKAADIKSSVRWSSHLDDDHFASYTGFSFQSADRTVNEGLLFDGLFYRMAKHRSHTVPKLLPDKGPGAGQLMLSLHRVDDFKFRSVEQDLPYPPALEKELLLELLDVEGNFHPLTFAYGVTGDEAKEGLADRDKLKLFLR